jgi:hypothetical protein
MYHEDICEEGEHKAEVWRLRRHQESIMCTGVSARGNELKEPS